MISLEVAFIPQSDLLPEKRTCEAEAFERHLAPYREICVVGEAHDLGEHVEDEEGRDDGRRVESAGEAAGEGTGREGGSGKSRHGDGKRAPVDKGAFPTRLVRVEHDGWREKSKKHRLRGVSPTRDC